MTVILPSLVFSGLSPADPGTDPIRLVLVVVVDQLRPDLLSRLHSRFGPGGFRRLMDGGTWFEAARCAHFPTFTSVGHAAIFTGAASAGHGIAANDWTEPETSAHVYCLEDPAHTLLGRKPKLHEGSSPRNLTATTIGDEMVLAARGRSRVFAVSGKDRAAILAAGHLGKAFWFAADGGEFVSSTYYYQAYPEWAVRWNAARLPDRYAGATWELSSGRAVGPGDPDDDRPAEKGHKRLGRVFPHILPAEPGAELYDALGTTPFGDELSIDFSLTLLEAEGLGRGPTADLLAVGLAATDAIGHAYGPSSLEYEDQVLRLDGLLAKLFAAVDRGVGRDRVLIVLTSDHGVDEIPEIRSAQGFPAGRLDGERMRQSMNRGLRTRFGIEADLIDSFWTPAFHVDPAAAAKAGLTVDRVAETAAEIVRTEPGVAWALTRADLLSGRVPDAPELRSVRRSVHPRLTGSIVVIQKPSWHFYDDPVKYAATHGSPYAYDAHVPLGIAGPGVAARHTVSPAVLEDIAPTIAALLGTAFPSASIGTPLLSPPQPVRDC